MKIVRNYRRPGAAGAAQPYDPSKCGPSHPCHPARKRSTTQPRRCSAAAGVRAPRLKAGGAARRRFAVSPITGELVPVSQMAEHMRVSLLDPKWKEQKDAMLAKMRGSVASRRVHIYICARGRPRSGATQPG